MAYKQRCGIFLSALLAGWLTEIISVCLCKRVSLFTESKTVSQLRKDGLKYIVFCFQIKRVKDADEVPMVCKYCFRNLSIDKQTSVGWYIAANKNYVESYLYSKDLCNNPKHSDDEMAVAVISVP